MRGSLDAAAGAWLVAAARAAIAEQLFGGDALATVRTRKPATDALAVPRACFVTLEAEEAPGRFALRGCVGSTEPRLPVDEAVVETAVQAAFEDPRFPPLSAAEYPAISLAVSALTPLAPVPSPEAIVAGRDGVVLIASGRRSIFLPEVAGHHGWSRTDLLVQLARKAGLPDDAWRRGELFVFSSERFAERPGDPDRIPAL